jgi:hypothetical protein
VQRLHALRVVRALLEEPRIMVVTTSIENEIEGADRRTGGRAVTPRIVGEVRRADEKLVSLVQDRPIATLCAAAVVGYLVGRVITQLS